MKNTHQENQKVWGENKVSKSIINFGSLRLRYCLSALEKVNGKVLELGCGAGSFTKAVKTYRPDLSLTGVDIDKNVIKTLKVNNLQNTYIKADIHALPFGDESFDAIVGFDVLEHIEDPAVVFREIQRVLKRGGVFHAAIPVEGSNYTLHGILAKMGIKPKGIYAGHIQQYTVNDIEFLLKQIKFVNVNYRFSGHLFFQMIDISYFLLLSLFKMRISHTMEGYREVLRPGFKKIVLSVLIYIIASVTYTESRIFSFIPGVILHITTNK